jgi:dTMP kinase
MEQESYKKIEKGLFISFEGIDYCGKSTQIKLLASRLLRDGYGVMVVREPGGTEISEKIRGILLDPVHQQMAAETELFLYEAARSQLTRQVIIPGKSEGKIILCDRYFDSTTAYQGYGRGLDIPTISRTNLLASHGIMPDITFLFDLDAETAQARFSSIPMFKDRLEEEKIEFHRRVRGGYLKIAAAEPHRFKILPADDDINTIADAVYEIVREFMR